MILMRNGIINIDQVEIACELGLTVPLEYKDMYKDAIIAEKPEAGYGTQIQNDKYSVNNFFRKYNIDLMVNYHFITDFSLAKNFLLYNINNDIIICCHCSTLYNTRDEDYGHDII